MLMRSGFFGLFLNYIKLKYVFIGFATSITFDEKLTTFFGICLVMSQVFLSGELL